LVNGKFQPDVCRKRDAKSLYFLDGLDEGKGKQSRKQESDLPQ